MESPGGKASSVVVATTGHSMLFAEALYVPLSEILVTLPIPSGSLSYKVMLKA